VKGSPHYNPLAAINDYIGGSYFLLRPSKLFLLFIEREEEKERLTKLANELSEKIPRKMKKQKNGASKSKNHRKSMYVNKCWW
jgi:hypothetical protein